MKLRKLGAALVVVAALGAVLASSALAAATTTDVKWYIGASPGVELTGSETITANLTGTASLATGPSSVLNATGIECVECKIENSGGVAVGSGKLKLTGITVQKPEKCSTGASITTKALSFSADWMSGEVTNYWRFVPASGETFLTFELSGGSECTGLGTLSHVGSLFLQTKNSTGTQAIEQPANSSATINKEAGGTTRFGTEAASLTATINFKLASGKAFGTH